MLSHQKLETKHFADDRLHPAPNIWRRKNAASFENDKKTRSHLESFLSEIKQSGVTPEGTVLCNCEVSQDSDS